MAVCECGVVAVQSAEALSEREIKSIRRERACAAWLCAWSVEQERG